MKPGVLDFLQRLRMNEGVQNFGHSAIVDPQGISIAGAGLAPTILKGEIDVEEARSFRKSAPTYRRRA
jgi:predicted amidohydrolase